MIFATYIDGHDKTPYRELLENHSTSVTVKIKPQHIKKWEDLLSDVLAEDIVYPTERSMPVPIVISTCELADVVSDTEEEEFVAPYIEDLKYMCEEDSSGMGYVYLMKNKA